MNRGPVGAGTRKPAVSSERAGATWVLPLEDLSSDTGPGSPPRKQVLKGLPEGWSPLAT